MNFEFYRRRSAWLDRTAGRIRSGLLSALLLLAGGAACAADKITECTVDGTIYKKISDVYETSRGRIGIFYQGGGLTVERSALSKEFLQSWGLNTAAAPQPASTTSLQANADWLRAQQAQEVDALVSAGLIRRVGNKIYDLRKTPSGWDYISRAKIVSMSPSGAVLDVPDRPANARLVFIANLPAVQDQNETVTALVKMIGFQKRTLERLGEVTTVVYDYGTVCAKEEVPLEILNTPVLDAPLSAWSVARKSLSVSAETRHAQASGSGFFVSPNGFLLTSYHVVATAAKVSVRHKGQILTAAVRQTDPAHDLALLKVEGNGFKWLPLATQNSARLGESVFTIGYPNPDLQGLEPKYSEGTISGLNGLRDDPREYQMSAPVQPGNSGGPVCNADGEVIGIVRAELNASLALANSGALPQGVNYAVKAIYAQQLLQSANLGTDLSADNPLARGASREMVRQRAQEAVAMVLVY